MISVLEGSRIPYEEYRAIVRLMHGHVDAHSGRLRAIVAFGDLVTRGGTFDIDLLEVVEEWTGPRMAIASATAELPLRGRLRVYILTPEEFEDPTAESEQQESRWISELLERVRQGYEIILQIPPGYAREVLDAGATTAIGVPPGDKLVTLSDPLRFEPSEH